VLRGEGFDVAHTVKLRVVATGTTFCLALALAPALTAQFALRQATPAAGGVKSPPMPPPR